MENWKIGAIIFGVLVLIGALIGLLIATGIIGGDSPPTTTDKPKDDKPKDDKTKDEKKTEDKKAEDKNASTANNQQAATAGVGIPAIPERLYKPPDMTALEFGGMYGELDGVEYNNPVTGTKECPTDFTAIKVKHANNLDYPLYYCYKEIDDPDNWTPSEGSAEFGGLYGNSAGVDVKNITTSGMSCPTGFRSFQVSGGILVPEKDLNMCYKKIVNPSTWKPSVGSLQFGGMYGMTYLPNPANVNNPTTNGMTCPTGFTSTKVLWTDNVDAPVNYCSKAWSK